MGRPEPVGTSSPSLRPFRFGVSCNAGGSAAEIRAKARRLEDLGYYSLLWQDHYAGPGPAVQAASHPPQTVAAIPAAVLAAEATTSLVVGFRVLCADYHHPVVLAKELATLDLLSGGRLEIGLGAGWMASEYAAMGIPFDSPGRRVERLAEVIAVLDACFADGPADFRGDSFAVEGFEGVPKPLQRPRPPLAIGGGGRRVLELAARRADIVSVNLDMRSGRLGAEAVGRSADVSIDERLLWIRGAAGQRQSALTLEIGVHFVAVTSDADEALEAMLHLPASVGRRHPHALVGTVGELCDLLEARREEWGFSYVTIQDRTAEAFAPVVRRLAGR